MFPINQPEQKAGCPSDAPLRHPIPTLGGRDLVLLETLLPTFPSAETGTCRGRSWRNNPGARTNQALTQAPRPRPPWVDGAQRSFHRRSCPQLWVLMPEHQEGSVLNRLSAPPPHGSGAQPGLHGSCLLSEEQDALPPATSFLLLFCISLSFLCSLFGCPLHRGDAGFRQSDVTSDLSPLGLTSKAGKVVNTSLNIN